MIPPCSEKESYRETKTTHTHKTPKYLSSCCRYFSVDTMKKPTIYFHNYFIYTTFSFRCLYCHVLDDGFAHSLSLSPFPWSGHTLCWNQQGETSRDAKQTSKIGFYTRGNEWVHGSISVVLLVYSDWISVVLEHVTSCHVW